MALTRTNRNGEMDFNEVMNLARDVVMSDINCHNVGKIIEFDATTQTCSVELMQIKQLGKNYLTPAPITQVPLIIYGSGNAHITLPNPVGSICLLFFLDRNIDNFLETGEQYVPDTTRMHDFTDCIAMTTFTTLANSLQNYDEEAISLLNNEIIENIQNETYFKVYPDSIQAKVIKTETTEDETITTKSNISIYDSTIELQSSGSNISISDRINIQNTAQNLATLIGEFLSACENIATVADESGGTLTSSSKQLFTDLKTKFEELLQ